ncbi:MAG: protein kinase [Nocardioides sp.]|nr:protein kinase [Nocardioides sp.]
MALPEPGALFGHYRILRQLGSGGMGVVHAAMDLRLNREVALKVMWPQLADEEGFRQRFEREAATLARVDSSHIVSIFDHGMQDGVLYIATQYVDGGDLSTLLRERGDVSPELATRICAQVADALRDAHNAGVVHRDVKPGNVLVRNPQADDPHVYLCDFGIARAQGNRELTATGSVTGSWAWMAPERMDGDPGNAASDIYALGCMLWACLHGGAAPYSGGDMEVAMAHLNDPIPQLPGKDALSHRLNQILARSMAKHPADRYRTAAQFRDELHFAAKLAADPVASRRIVSRRRGGVLPLVLAGAIVLAGGTWWVTSDRTDPSPAGFTSAAAAIPPPRIAGDADGDGDGDLQVVWYRQKGKSLITWPTEGDEFDEPRITKGPEGGMEVGDFDGDRQQDQLDIHLDQEDARAGQERGGKATLVITPIESEPSTSTVQLPSSLVTVQPFVGDFNGDGKDDLAFAAAPQEGESTIWVMASDGKTFAEPESWMTTSDMDMASVLAYAGDFDGDGDDDIALQDGRFAKRGRLQMFRNDGTSAAAAGSPRSFRHHDTGAFTVGDVDGDRKDEMVHANLVGLGTTEVAIYEGTEDGFVKPASWLSTTASGGEDVGPVWGTWELSVTDLNGDGRGDLVRFHSLDWAEWQIEAFISTGENFEPGTRWRKFSCDDDCKNAGALVTTHMGH